MEKKIEIGKKVYTLTSNRKIIKTIYNICPEVLALGNEDSEEVIAKKGTPIAIDLFANLDDLFFDMIKIAHPEISREKSNDILDKFIEEYDDVPNKLLEFAMSVFTEGAQDKKVAKKKIDW